MKPAVLLNASRPSVPSSASDSFLAVDGLDIIAVRVEQVRAIDSVAADGRRTVVLAPIFQAEAMELFHGGL